MIVLCLLVLISAAAAQNAQCGNGIPMILCNSFSCARHIDLCPKLDNSTCPSSLFKCPTPGVCVANISHCPTNITCSGNKILCWNGICSNTTCPPYIDCPTFAPFKCPNGECRANLFDCPQPKTCPAIAPYKCFDESCRAFLSDCNSVEDLFKLLDGYVKCPDGRLMPSLSLCGTQRTCPIGYIKCWSGACVKSLDSCDKLCPKDAPFLNQDGTCTAVYSKVMPMCTDSSLPYYCDGQCVSNYDYCYKGIICKPNSVMCNDGSCRNSFDACPTETLCPIEKPVKCYDGSCSTSIYTCPPMSDCPTYAKRCPNGQCVVSSATCGTGVTCTAATPVKCYDNTCRKDSNECPVIPACPANRTFLCSDGSCQRSPEQCYPETQCQGSQIKCPDYSCVSSLAECRELKGCPPGMYPCPDKSCRPSAQLCPKDTCPKIMPFMCLDGMCVQDKSECNSNSTGCPQKTPLKCSDGTCTDKISSCTKELILTISDEQFLCPDGSLSDNIDTCYSVYGCPSDYPYMCYDGTCIDLSKQTCSVANCPITLPYRCSDGQCVESKSMCKTLITEGECKNSSGVPCADGVCRTKAEFCRPLSPCGYGYIRCADGSCRRDVSLCPIGKQLKCPVNRSYRCTNGACVNKTNMCVSTSTLGGCTAKKCDDINGNLVAFFGRCVNVANDCIIPYSTSVIYNGCTAQYPVRCADFSCAETNDACTNKVGTICKSTEFRCDMNVTNPCVDSQTKCAITSPCYSTYLSCISSNNCPFKTPFRCADGTCAAVPFYPFILSNMTIPYCKPRVICPSLTPYLCDDGSCQGNPQRCTPIQPKIRCLNGEPADNLADCASKEMRCPPLRPILCSSGICVSKVQECIKYEPLCPASTPIRCISGVCVANYAQCVPFEIRLKDITTNSRCPAELPFLCPDGSCALDNTLCIAIVKACNDPLKPVKCQTGSCVADVSDCIVAESSIGNCDTNYRRCEDGICRLKCPDYNGCPLKKPVQCPNGYCGASVGECAGISDCPLERPFNCYNGVCVKSFADCALHPRSVKPETIMITVDSSQEIDADIVVNSTGAVLGKLYVPSNTLGIMTNNTTISINLVVRQVSDSKLRKYPVPISEKILPYVKEKCQIGYDRLDSLLIIQSPAVNVSATKAVTKLNNFLTLQLYTVIPKGASVNDFCLGRIDDVSLVWKCYSRDLKDVTDGRFLYLINEVGSYAVIFSPLTAPQESYWTGVYIIWFVENPRLTALYFLLIILIILFIVLSLWCVSIQMKEYRRTAQELKDYQKALRENFGGLGTKEDLMPSSHEESGEISSEGRPSGKDKLKILEADARQLKSEHEQAKSSSEEEVKQ